MYCMPHDCAAMRMVAIQQGTNIIYVLLCNTHLQVPCGRGLAMGGTRGSVDPGIMPSMLGKPKPVLGKSKAGTQQKE